MSPKALAIVSIMVVLAILPVGCSTGGEGTIDVPVKILTDQEVAGVAFELLYDPAVLEATTVDTSTLALGAKAAYGVVEPGRLFVQVLNAPNMNRNGTLVVAHFKVLDQAGTSTLAIDFKAAEDADSHQALPFQVSDGRFVAPDMSVEAPVVTIG